jgi:outer membrane receptor protein involved in Fe transport
MTHQTTARHRGSPARFAPLPLLAVIAALIAGMPFAAAQVTWAVDTSARAAGNIDGTLVKPAGAKASIEGLTVTIVETGQSTTTDKYGHYELKDVKPGTYTLLATGGGYSRLRVTDVAVQPGHTLTLGAQEMPMVMKAGEVQMMEEVIVSAKRDVEVMEKYLVTGEGVKPFANTSNLDIPRTIDDPQPYYMWNSQTIDNSAATNVQDFISRMVPMDTVKGNSAQGNLLVFGSISNFNLGGLGGNNGSTILTSESTTLVLVDGRRLANLNSDGFTEGQPNLNGIPMGAIDHIEVLTSSASAIYGPSAAGGVINVVLKHDYVGTDLKMTYENTTNKDNPIRSVTITTGMGLEGGKTSVLMTLSYQIEKDPNFQDRGNVFMPYLTRYISNLPGGILTKIGLYNSLGVWAGTSATYFNQYPIIKSVNNTPLFPGLSPATYVQVPAGYQSPAVNGLGPLIANAGKPLDMELGNNRYFGTSLTPLGKLSGIEETPMNRSFMINIRREMLKNLEAYVDFSYTSDLSHQEINRSGAVTVNVPATVPWNPFGQAVVIAGLTNVPLGNDIGNESAHTLSVGLKADLPRDWKADLDWTYGNNYFSYFAPVAAFDTGNLAAATASSPNPIRDMGAYPMPYYPDFGQYTYPSTVDDLTLKGSGPLMKLWAGTPTLTVSVEHRREGNDTGHIYNPYYPQPNNYPATVSQTNSNSTYFGQSTNDDSVGAELLIPLVQKSNRIPGVQRLELQLAGRQDWYHEYITTPVSETVSYNSVTGVTTYSPALKVGVGSPTPIHGVNQYNVNNGTFALKYIPTDGVTLRWSYADAIIPPSFSQLQAPVSAGTTTNTNIQYPGVPTTTPWGFSTIVDPLRGNASYLTPVMSGGNINLKPETTRTLDWGIILEPTFAPGLRISFDYNKTTIYGAIVSPTTTQILTYPQFASRITRGPNNPGDPAGYAGPVILIDDTTVNAVVNISSTYNLQLNYMLRTQKLGTWSFTGTGSMWQHYQVQTAVGLPLLEELSNPNPGNTTPNTGFGFALAKSKGNIGVDWNKDSWAAGWVARYTGPYDLGTAYGPGGSSATQGTINGWIPGQIYHDAYVRYRWGKVGSGRPVWERAMANSSLTFGVKNVFDTRPPYDAAGGNGYYSLYGDIRMQDYYFTYKKSF